MNNFNKTNCREAVPVNFKNLDDDAIFDILYKKYWEQLLAFAKKYIADRETCKEIVQELFIAIHLKRNKISINVSFSAYLFRSMRNKIINYLRKESIYKKHVLMAGKSFTGITACNDAEQWMDVHDLEQQIIRCLHKMPGKYREVYVLAMQKTNSIQQTAEILQRPVATVERQLRVSVRLIQEHLNKYRLLLLILLYWLPAQAQTDKGKITLKDSMDKHLDLSDYVIKAHGFVPVPYLITEPALGGFGGALLPVFIKKRPPYLDSVNGELKPMAVPPDITGGIGVYTLNNTWALAAFRTGTFIKPRIRYTIGAAYANVNMKFYRNFERLGERELAFNIKIIPAILQASKRIGISHWYTGFKYFFLKADTRYEGDTSMLNLVKSLESSKIISQLGVLVELDNRDNIFTPYKGFKVHTDFNRADNILGSDYEYWRIAYFMYAYQMVIPNITAGFRLDGQQVFGDAPFYMLPYIDMRGIPIYRYQGNADILSELEFRWDFTRRWSAMLFGGAGKAFDTWSEFGDTDWVASYGTGFRYLLARKFKLRVGIDVAHGPDAWAYYIVFGSSWLK
jgi:RNA polymerase sigma factor (sigma-70 family)